MNQIIAFPFADESFRLGLELWMGIEDHAGEKSAQAHLLCRQSGFIHKVVHVL